MIPLGHLDLSPLNPRQDEPTADALERLADNIRAVGLIHPLAGLRGEDGRVGIVAGGRRLRAIRAIAAREPGRFDLVPVKLALDEVTARLWAASENAVREPLHPADEIAAFGRMAGEGAAVPQIALAFGTTEAHVHRRLRLAGLPAPVLAALRADRISLGAAAVFTLCGSEARALDVLSEIEDRPIYEGALRRRLIPETVGSDDRRAVFVGADAYQVAGGRITSDLFGGADVWEDPELLDALFRDKLAAEARRLTEEAGWLWAEADPDHAFLGFYDLERRKLTRIEAEPGILSDAEEARFNALSRKADGAASSGDRLPPEETAELAALEEIAGGAFTPVQRSHAGVVVYVGPRGDLLRADGLIRLQDRAAAVAAGVLPEPTTAHGADVPPASPYSLAVMADLRAIRLAAIQRALLDRPELVLDLLAFGFAQESGGVVPLNLRPETAPNRPAERSGFEEDPRLHRDEVPWYERPYVPDAELPASFAAFRTRAQEERSALCIAGLARTLPNGAMADVVAAMTRTDIRAVWRPDEANFLRRMKSAGLDELLVELLGLEPNDKRLIAFRGTKKAQKATVLRDLFAGDEKTCAAWGVTPEQRADIDAWLPEPLRDAELATAAERASEDDHGEGA